MSTRIDVREHLLIAGHSGSGKTALVRHLLARESTGRPVTVIDALGKVEYDRITDREVTYVSGHGNGEMAAWAIEEALGTPGSILVVEDADLIIGASAVEHLLAVGTAVEHAMVVGSANDITVIVTMQRVSAEFAASFESRVLLTSGQPVAAGDWAAIFGSAPAPVEITAGHGTGFHRDDTDAMHTLAFGWDVEEQGC